MGLTAVYAGSFDPPTNGHVWMMGRGARLFERLIVAVGLNSAKRATFSIQQRVDWLREICRPWPNIQVASFEDKFLVNYAKEVGATVILRGIRNSSDYQIEQAMRNINGDLYPDFVPVFLMPPRELAEVSSSLVRQLVGPCDWQRIVSRYVPECVMPALSKLLV